MNPKSNYVLVILGSIGCVVIALLLFMLSIESSFSGNLGIEALNALRNILIVPIQFFATFYDSWYATDRIVRGLLLLIVVIVLYISPI